MTVRTDLATVRAVLDDAARTNPHAASKRHGVHSRSIFRWQQIRAEHDGNWPTDDHIAAWRAQDEALRETRLHNAQRTDRYRRKLYLNRGLLMVESTGTARRLQALMALGWTGPQLAAELDVTRARIGHMANQYFAKVTPETRTAVADLYDRWSMIVPVDEDRPRVRGEKRTHDSARALARRKGWAPPLAWDDETIDDPSSRPRGGGRDRKRRDEVDFAVVERFLAGEHTLETTATEKIVIARRWVDLGRSQGVLERATGWNVSWLLRTGAARAGAA